MRAKYPGCVVMSAKRESDVARLREAIVAFFQRGLVEAELFLPWSAQKLRGQIFATCTVLEERPDAEGAFLRVLVSVVLDNLAAAETPERILANIRPEALSTSRRRSPTPRTWRGSGSSPSRPERSDLRALSGRPGRR